MPPRVSAAIGGQSGVKMGFRLNTDSSSLSPSQLPIASGTGAPGLVTGLPIQVGIRDPAQIVTFAEGAVQAASPNGWAKFQRQETTLKRKTLSKLAAAPGGLGHGKHLKSFGGGAYSVADSGRTIVMGVIGDQFVLGVPAKGAAMRASTLRPFASAPSAPAAGANGAVSFRIALGELIALASKSTPSPLARQILGLLGDVTGSMSATTGALSGTATLSLK